MRIASWIFVVCALVGAFGVFVPAFELPLGGHVVSKHETISLRKAASHRALLRKLLAAYRGTGGTKLGKVMSSVTPHTGGRLKSVLDDANDAMDTVSGISDDDAKRVGTIVWVVVWSFVALNVTMAGLVFLDLVASRFRRRRIIVALVISVVVAAVGVAILFGCKAAVFEANDELGAQALSLGAAPYVIAAAALGALVSSIVLCVLDVRSDKSIATSEPDGQ